MVKAKTEEKERALCLRKEGESVSDIAIQLGVSRSSISNWCKDILLSQEQIQRLEKKRKEARQRGSVVAAERKRVERKKRVEKFKTIGAFDVGHISKRDLFMLGLGLYWGEGYKSDNGELGFTNSDPNLIRVYIEWLNQIYKIKKKDLILRIGINVVHKDRESIVLDYWSRITNISQDQFTKTSFIRSKIQKEYSNMENHYGTLRVKVRRGTNLQRRILGSIEHLGSRK